MAWRSIIPAGQYQTERRGLHFLPLSFILAGHLREADGLFKKKARPGLPVPAGEED